jgi:hypothetical protein
LVEMLRGHAGQAILTTTEVEQIPGAGDGGVVQLTVDRGTILDEVTA